MTPKRYFSTIEHPGAIYPNTSNRGLVVKYSDILMHPELWIIHLYVIYNTQNKNGCTSPMKCVLKLWIKLWWNFHGRTLMLSLLSIFMSSLNSLFSLKIEFEPFRLSHFVTDCYHSIATVWDVFSDDSIAVSYLSSSNFVQSEHSFGTVSMHIKWRRNTLMLRHWDSSLTLNCNFIAILKHRWQCCTIYKHYAFTLSLVH